MVVPWVRCAFQVGVDLGGQAAQAVGDLAGEVVVEADDHLQLGDGLVGELDGAQGVGHGAGGVRDDEGVAGVGLASRIMRTTGGNQSCRAGGREPRCGAAKADAGRDS